MAFTLLHSLSFPNPLCLNQLYQSQTPTTPSTLPFKKDQHSHFFSIKCTSSNSAPLTESDDTDESSFPPPVSTTLNNSDYPIEKRRRSQIIRDRKAKTDLVKGEPPNYQVGWKRTKEIKLEKPVGYVIMDFLDKLVELMDKEFGSTALLAKVGEIVAERAREEAEVLRDEGKVEDRMVTELFRVLKLMEMDLAMVKAAVKEETLNERLEQAKARCRQAILVANSF
ncbi:PREDICTED: uncharacterized protein LOC105120210 [Populus euphratica]|uniref:Uncharacterized protein LOC105120210 n=1 Tax=Populus euphratica TaxID=75702 RepID=A0AAJ6XF58_POPEU|nr:PREDICTED: uncharacterized protein LOC105120210 [Populus euphratica]